MSTDEEQRRLFGKKRDLLNEFVRKLNDAPDPPCVFCGEPVAVGTSLDHCPEAWKRHREVLASFGLCPSTTSRKSK
jgi:hypothetical protein